MRILVLSRNASLYSTSRIVLAARARGHSVLVVDPLAFQIVVSRGKPALMLSGQPCPPVDLVIPRIGASITNYGLAVVRQFDMMGIPVLNSAVSIARSRDKLRALQLLTRRKLDVPITVCARTPESIDGALDLVGGTPAIVKIQQGTQGIGTMIAETRQAVSSLLETLWAMGQDIVLQEYIAESKGRDIRTIVVGGRVVASMRRTAKAGEFRSNLHRGGLAVKVALPPAYRTAAVAAVRVMGLEVAGVDLLEARGGPKILEINSSPGLEGIERASGLDVAGAIVRHAERFAKNTKRASSRVVMSRIDAVLEDERKPRRRAASRLLDQLTHQLFAAGFVDAQRVREIVQQDVLVRRDGVVGEGDGARQDERDFAANRVFAQLAGHRQQARARTFVGSTLLGCLEHRQEVRRANAVVELAQSAADDVSLGLRNGPVGGHHQVHHLGQRTVLAEQERALRVGHHRRRRHDGRGRAAITQAIAHGRQGLGAEANHRRILPPRRPRGNHSLGGGDAPRPGQGPAAFAPRNRTWT